MTEALYSKDFESYSMPLNQMDPMSDSTNESFPMSPFNSQTPPSGYSSELINSPEELFGQPFLEQPPLQQTQQQQQQQQQQHHSMSFEPQFQQETKVFVVQQQQTIAPNFLNVQQQSNPTPTPTSFTTTTTYFQTQQTKLPTLPLIQQQQQQQHQTQSQQSKQSTYSNLIVLPELPKLQQQQNNQPTPAGSSPDQSPQMESHIPLTAQIQKHKKIKKRKHDETSPVSDGGHSETSSTYPTSTPITEANFRELSAQQMLELDSNQIEDYIRIFCNRKNVTAAEDKELKKIRRLIKNREYAQSSRDKKKQHMDEVESRMNEVTMEMKELKDENVILKRNINLVADAAQRDPELANKLRILAPTLDLTCGSSAAAKLSKNNQQHQQQNTNQNGHQIFSVPDINSFVPQAGAINLPSSHNFNSIASSSATSTTTTTTTTGNTRSKSNNGGKSAANASKRVKTSVGVVSLFVVALAFGMFVNNLSSLPARSTIVNSGAANWRTGRVLFSVEKWYHSYTPNFMHPWLDTFFTLFDNEMEEHSLELHTNIYQEQQQQQSNTDFSLHNTISTSANEEKPSSLDMRVESDGVGVKINKRNVVGSRGDL